MYVYGPSLLAGWLADWHSALAHADRGGSEGVHARFGEQFILCSDLYDARLAVAGGTDAANVGPHWGLTVGVNSRLRTAKCHGTGQRRFCLKIVHG